MGPLRGLFYLPVISSRIKAPTMASPASTIKIMPIAGNIRPTKKNKPTISETIRTEPTLATIVANALLMASTIN